MGWREGVRTATAARLTRNIHLMIARSLLTFANRSLWVANPAIARSETAGVRRSPSCRSSEGRPVVAQDPGEDLVGVLARGRHRSDPAWGLFPC
jgi:hypothetical protein